MSSICAIGLMSGTSYDGVDVALLNTDGETIDRVGPTGYRPYSEQERAVVRRAISAGANLSLANRAERPKILADAEELVTDMHAEAVEAFLAANGMPPSAVSVIGFHGQTILHRPDRGMTVQLGNGRALAARLGIPVVYDFRAADIAAGGQGAPVVPVFHRAMVRMLKEPHPIGVLNVGGVANVTFIDRDARSRRLRHRPRQCADRRLLAIAHRPDAGRRGPHCGCGQGRRGGGRTRADPSVLCAASAEVARPQRLPPLGERGGAACRQEHRGWRRDHHRHHGRGGRSRDDHPAGQATRAGSWPAAVRATRP